jgi:hypothetical protein
MAVEKMQFSMPMATGYEGVPFTATQVEKEAEPEAFTLKPKVKKRKAEEPSFVIKTGCGSKTKASDETPFMVLAGRRGVDMAEPDEVDYSSDKEFDSDEDLEVIPAKICDKFEWRTWEMLVVLPRCTFEFDASILKRQEDYKREQELKKQHEEVSLVI